LPAKFFIDRRLENKRAGAGATWRSPVMSVVDPLRGFTPRRPDLNTLIEEQQMLIQAAWSASISLSSDLLHATDGALGHRLGAVK
jgi:hypothetical protein